MSGRVARIGAAAFGIVVLALAGISAASGAQRGRESAAVCNVNEPAPLHLSLRDPQGAEISLSRFKGKIVLINFWATWCEPCRIEIPDLNDLYRRYQRRGVEILGINVDESSAAIDKYRATTKIDYPVLLTEGRHDVVDAFRLGGLPTTIVVNRDGTICRTRVGLTRKDFFERLLDLLL